MARLIIRETAKKQGLNQSQLQMRAGVTPQLLNRYWNNHTQSVALEPLEKIAHALGVKSGDLIVDDEARKEKPKELITEEGDEEDDDIAPGAILKQALARANKLTIV